MAQERRSGGVRQCQPCTACCDGWVRITVAGREVSPGHPCQHSTGSGCRIYGERPEQCRRFQCAWIMPNSPLPDWLKPSEARVMMLPGAREWQGRPVDLALPVGRRIPPRALQWLKQFSQAYGRPLLFLEHEPGEEAFSASVQVHAHGPAGFQEEIILRLERGERLW